jgi:2-hydroxychromene-2-carboxylate isomerase
VAPDQPTFFYDLGDPECYLIAEVASAALPVVPEWEPVLAGTVPAKIAAPDPEGLARRTAQAGLQPLRWPAGWPHDAELAMLAATYAKHIGRVVAFSLAAFRQAYAGGRDLSDESTVLIAAAACEMHPAALLKAVGLRSVRQGLDRAGQRARACGVTALPAISLADETFSGPGCLDSALAAAGLGATP